MALSNKFNQIFPVINPNRTVKMVCSNTGAKYADRNWRSNLRRLITDQKNNRGNGKPEAFMFKDSENWDVHHKIELLMEDNKGIKITNATDKPLSGLANGFGGSGDKKKSMLGNLTQLAAGAATAISAIRNADSDTTSGVFMPWISNVTAWGGSNKVDVECTFNFSMGQYGMWNAKEEVVKPIFNLLAPFLPQYLNAFMQYGAFPHSFDLLAKLIADVGESANDFINDVKEQEEVEDSEGTTFIEKIVQKVDLQNLAKTLEKLLLNTYTSFTYDITFGNSFTFYKMLPISATVKFSNEVDQYGYPISGSIETKFEGLVPVTLSSSDDMNRGVSFGGV